MHIYICTFKGTLLSFFPLVGAVEQYTDEQVPILFISRAVTVRVLDSIHMLREEEKKCV